MKPDGPVARRGDYTFAVVPMNEAVAFISAHHYAKGCSHTAVYRHGLYRSGLLVGVALWLPPTKRCAMTVHSKWRRVLSLSRLAIVPAEPQNAASMLIGRSLKVIRAEEKWKAVVTFADESEGHTGVIYRATGWRYVGKTKPTARWKDVNGRQVSRLSTKTRTVTQMRALGLRVVGRYAKHKFVMLLERGAR